MKDTRGVERGCCTKCSSCKEYELDKNSSSAACSYCFCPPTNHKEITDVSSPTASFQNRASFPGSSGSSSFSSTSLSLSSSSFSEATPICIEVPNSSNSFLNTLLMQGNSATTIEPTSDEIEALFPSKFGKIVDKALEQKKVLGKHKDAMCRKIVDKLIENEKANNVCLRKAAKRITKRYSPFKSSLPKSDLAVYEKLKRRRNRLNLDEKQPGKIVEEVTPGNISAADAKTKMKMDWAASIRGADAYRESMALTRTLRQEDAKKLPGLQLMREYPALGLTEIVLEEFAFMMEVSQETMLQNWRRALPNLLDYYKENKVPCIDQGTTAEKTLSILQTIHLIPLWKKAPTLQKRTTFVLEKFPVNTSLPEVRPGPKDPPRLIVIGDDIHCFFDTEPFFVVQDPEKAILLLLSAYFLFGIKWFPSTRLPIITLCCCTIGALKVALDINRNNKLEDFLKKIKVM